MPTDLHQSQEHNVNITDATSSSIPRTTHASTQTILQGATANRHESLITTRDPSQLTRRQRDSRAYKKKQRNNRREANVKVQTEAEQQQSEQAEDGGGENKPSEVSTTFSSDARQGRETVPSMCDEDNNAKAESDEPSGPSTSSSIHITTITPPTSLESQNTTTTTITTMSGSTSLLPISEGFSTLSRHIQGELNRIHDRLRLGRDLQSKLEEFDGAETGAQVRLRREIAVLRARWNIDA